MRVVWLTGLAACLAVPGCTPPPGGYYGAPPGYVPQPYAATPGGVSQQPLPPPDQPGVPEGADPGPGYADPAYAQPGYSPPGYYSYGTPPPPYGYAPPPPVFLPLGGPFGGRDRFDRNRFDQGRFDRDRFERERFQRERFQRERGQERFERDRPRPVPVQQPAPPLQGQARPQDFRRPPDPRDRRGLTPEQMRGLR